MLLVVGGNSHGIGKTSVAAGIVRALRAANWTAVKITQYDASDCTTGGSCSCDGTQHPYVMSEETEYTQTDSGRFLAAGAVKSYWLRSARGNLGFAIPVLRFLMQNSENLLLESNSVLQFFRPDLYLMVLDPTVKDLKDSARWFFDRADAYVVVDKGAHNSGWKGVPARWMHGKPKFKVQPPKYSSAELVQFVQSALGKETSKASQP